MADDQIAPFGEYTRNGMYPAIVGEVRRRQLSDSFSSFVFSQSVSEFRSQWAAAVMLRGFFVRGD
jgi:hypothetical protein